MPLESGCTATGSVRDSGDDRSPDPEAVVVFVLVLGGLWALWEGYKWLWERTGWTRPFRGERPDDAAPPRDRPAARRADVDRRRPVALPPATRRSSRHVRRRSASCSARSSASCSECVLAQFDVLRRGVMPYVVASQTIPILALAPIVVRGLGSVSIGGWPPPDWVRVSVIAAYLDVLPGHRQHAARAPVRGSLGARADALVRGARVDDPVEAPRSRRRSRTSSRRSRSLRPRAWSARSSARPPPRSRRGSAARSSTSTSTTSSSRRTSGRRTSSPRCSGSRSSSSSSLAEKLVVHRAPERLV